MSSWRPQDFKWTVTDRKPKNLAQLFVMRKGGDHHEVRNADSYSSSQYEAISKCLDEFIGNTIVNKEEKRPYAQIIFNE